MSSLKLLLLGPPRLERDNVPVGLERRKALALLAFLAVTGEPQPREALATLLWPDHDESQGHAYLRRALWTLKQALGVEQVAIGRERIGLASNSDPLSDVWLDVAYFRRLLAGCTTHGHPPNEVCAACLPLLAEAVALHRADFMAGFTLPDTPEFDDWQFFQAESLRRDLAAALERLVSGHSSQGDLELAIVYARRWSALDPLHEPAQRCLMQLYAQAGQRTAALRQYEECQRLLAAELGGSPEQETTALYEAIKTRKIVERGGGMGARVQSPAASPSSTIPLPPFLSAALQQPGPTAPFVAREHELAELAAALATARSGVGQILFVIGGAGRGKTMLVQEFARRAQAVDAELLVVSGYGNAHTGIGDPYLPFREALTMLSGEVDTKWAGGLITAEHARRLWEAMPLTLPTLIEHAPDLVRAFVLGKGLRERAASFAPAEAPWFKQLVALTSADAGAKVEQQRIFAQYSAGLSAIASQRPLLLILEDLHWADSASSGLLFHLSREASRSRILVVGTYRPDEVALSRGEIQHPLADILSELKRWHGDIWLDLGELAEAEGRRFVEAYLDTQPNRLGPGFREALFGRTGGHALFTVELLREMQERGDVRQDAHGQWIEGPAIDWNTLPARVEGVIEKRIQRLEKELQAILTIASVEGETFTAEVVARVQQLSERGLVQQLSRELDRRHRLVTAQILAWFGQQRLSLYRFRHQLFQHYLYHNLADMERAYLHEAVGSVLEAIYGQQTEVVTHRCMGWSFCMGELVSARPHFEQIAALYNPEQHRPLTFQYGQDPGMAGLSAGALDLWLLGYPEQARQWNDRAIMLGREASHANTLAFSLDAASWFHQFCQEPAVAQKRAEEAIAICTKQGLALWLAWGMIIRGWALAEQGQGEAGIVQIRQGLDAAQATGAEFFRPYYLALLAQAYQAVGQPEVGLSVLAEALVQVEKTQERFWEAEVYRLQGELLLQAEATAEAEDCFLKALEVARRQAAKSLELRATVSLGRLWQRQGKKDEARQMLAEMYSWFTEGLDTVDVRQANVLLEELSA